MSALNRLHLASKRKSMEDDKYCKHNPGQKPTKVFKAIKLIESIECCRHRRL